MINNNVASNIPLTDDQNAQLDEYRKTLANLLSEINNATKILKGTTLESNRAVKERAYQEELLNTLTPQVETLLKNYTELTENRAKLKNTLHELGEEIRIKTIEHETKKTELNVREDKIVSRETELSNLGSTLGKKEILLNNDKATFNQKVAKLKEVISTF